MIQLAHAGKNPKFDEQDLISNIFKSGRMYIHKTMFPNRPVMNSTESRKFQSQLERIPQVCSANL